MLKNRKGCSLFKSFLLLSLLFGLTWYASYYMGREDRLINDIKEARGEKTGQMFEDESAETKGKKKAVIPPGTEVMPAAVNIKGDKKFKSAVTDALGVLYNVDQQTYKFVRDNISEIRNGNNSGFYKDNGQRVAEVSNANAFYTSTWLAGILAHQAYHSWYDSRVQMKKKKKKGPLPSPGKAVQPLSAAKEMPALMISLMNDVTTQETAFAGEERCAKFQLQVLKLVGAKHAEINFVANRPPREFNYAHDGNFTLTP